jgi:DNA-binding beta-propeller fold protein YncE
MTLRQEAPQPLIQVEVGYLARGDYHGEIEVEEVAAPHAAVAVSLIERMSLLVTSASGTNGAGYGAILGFDDDGNLIGPFSRDTRIVDPRGLALGPSSGGLIYVNSGSDRVLALDKLGDVVRDSGRVSGLDPGGANFGQDGRYYLTARRRQTILSMSPFLDVRAEPVLPDHAVPFPRGFAFARDGRLYLASGIGPSGEGDNAIVVFDRKGAFGWRASWPTRSSVHLT